MPHDAGDEEETPWKVMNPRPFGAPVLDIEAKAVIPLTALTPSFGTPSSDTYGRDLAIPPKISPYNLPNMYGKSIHCRTHGRHGVLDANTLALRSNT